jgi:predicted aldo/keto reductase-like oxidoreductase
MLKESELGRTKLKVNRLGFGGIPIQRISEEEAIRVVRSAYEMSINFFDTARAYTNSEEKIGKALKDVREEVYIATKSVQRRKEGLVNDLNVSLKNLQTEWIDLYQLHMVSKKQEWETICGPEGALEGLLEARDEGKIRHIGITSHNPELMMDVLKTDIFETVMIPFNYMTHRPLELLQFCKDSGIGTIIMKPFGGGALTNKRAALKYVLGNENADIAIPGMMSLEELTENLEVCSGDYTLSQKDLQHIDKDKQELGNMYCRACDYCLPCPQGIPISFVLRAEDQLLRLTGWTPRLLKQIPEAKGKVATCIRCGECEGRCPYQLPIRELLQTKMARLLDLLEQQKHRYDQ